MRLANHRVTAAEGPHLLEKIDEIPEPSPSASPIAPARPIARNRLRETAVSIATFLAFWGIYLATGNYQPSPFNAHVYLAYSLLHRRFDLIDPPGFFETVRFAGHTYIAYGIGPSLLMLPFVAIWGLDFRQPVFAAALAAAAVTLWSAMLTHLRFRGRSRILLTLLFGLGSLVWFYGGAKGNSWSLMHVTTLFGLTLAIYETLARGRGWLTGLAFGIAVLSRQTVLLALPFFVWSLWRDGESPRRNLNRELGFALCLCAPILFDAYYNAARFGSPWDSGYPRVIVAITALRFRPWGLFSLNYVAANARTYFLKLPENLPSFPWYDPTMAGFSIFISTPALLLAIAADYRKRLNLLALAACISIQAFYLAYFWSGYEQFGCRYTLDYLPFLNLLSASGSRNRPPRTLLIAVIAGSLVELWGIGWWRYKGW